MARAAFDPGQRGYTPPAQDPKDFMINPQRRAEGEKLHLSGRDRALYSEDLSDGELGRLERKHQEWQSGLPDRMSGRTDQKPTKKSKSVARAVAGNYHAPGITVGGAPSGETYEQSAGRVLRTGAEDNASTRMPGEGAAGSGWYYGQNRAYRGGINTNDADFVDRVITGGSAMSPLNDPDMERSSAIEIANAHAEGRTVQMSQQVAGWVNRQKGTSGLVPKSQTSTPVPISDLHPEVVSSLSRSERRKLMPAFDRKSSVDFATVAKGGVNVAKGVSGIRGDKGVEDLSPALSAPKVNTYTHNNLDFQAARSGDEEHYKALVDEAAGGPAPTRQRANRFELTDGLVEHALARHGKGSAEFDPNDRAVRELELNRGRAVNMDLMHPANVAALGDRGVRETRPDVQHAALTSANHPTVGDSWVNAAIAGQPQATVLPEGYFTKKKRAGGPLNPMSAFKEAGSESVGYWNSKTLESGEPILSVKDGRVGPSALLHTNQDHILRQAAHRSPEVLGTSTPTPSVGVQESLAWTAPRRVAGKDPAYNKHLRGTQFS
jgi:hypothetical protein